MVVQAYILIQTDVGKAAEVARSIAQVKGVTLAEDVTGPYDVIVRAEARNVDELGKLVVSKVQSLDGITGPSPAPSSTSDLARPDRRPRPRPSAARGARVRGSSPSGSWWRPAEGAGRIPTLRLTAPDQAVCRG
jgi:hypothetical protein